jgi:hypothetical protein
MEVAMRIPASLAAVGLGAALAACPSAAVVMAPPGGSDAVAERPAAPAPTGGGTLCVDARAEPAVRETRTRPELRDRSVEGCRRGSSPAKGDR